MKPIISIIGGKGKMGKLFADFFMENGIKVLVSDVGTKLSNQEIASKGDIVIVAVSMGKAVQVIKEVRPFVREDALLCDITSIKEEPVKAMLKSKGEVLGLHPMFGASNPIPGQMIILCPIKGRSKKLSEWMETFLRAHDVKIKKLTPREHDKTMTQVQGLVHFADIVFAHAMKDLKINLKEFLSYVSPASDIKTLMSARLLAQDAHLYGNIQILNGQNPPVIKKYIQSAEKLYKIVKKKDLAKFEDYFNSSAKYLGEYAKEAYKESSWLIDEILSHRREQKRKSGYKVIETKYKKSDLAVLGPIGTFSSLAAQKFLPSKNLAYFKTIPEVFEAVSKGKIESGLVPIENRLHGTVRETVDALFYQNVQIKDAVNLDIHHAFITLPHAKMADIKKIASHPQALEQCKKYIKGNFPRADLEPVASTAKALHQLIVSQNKHLAVIAHASLAAENGLKVLKSNIENEKNNSTRFVLITKGEIDLAKNETLDQYKNKKYTSIAFYFDKDSPGSLLKVFQDFSDARINLSKIESRPATAKYGEYIFYIDFEGCLASTKVQKVLQKVQSKVKHLKVLGTY